MTQRNSAVPGQFCWFEVVTSDLAHARRTWGELFGWSFEDMPMPDGTPYTLAQVGGVNVCGLTVLSTAEQRMKVGPHTLSYVAVDDVDQAVKRVAPLGGTVVLPPLEAGPGRMAVVQDPVKATFALWQQRRSTGWLFGDVGALCWTELLASDPARARPFYTQLFGWEAQDEAFGNSTYTVFRQGETQVGGLTKPAAPLRGVPSAWASYLHVPDTDQAVKRLQRLGGKALGPAVDVPRVGRIAMLQDGQGVAFAVLQPTLDA